MKMDEEITKIAKRFKHKIQKIVDEDNGGITKITIQIEDNPPVTIAENKPKELRKKEQ